MKLTLAIIFVLCVVSIDAKPKKDGRARNGGSSSEADQPRNGSKKKPPNLKGYKSKDAFPLFKSCRDFNEEYSIRRKELKRNHEIWAGNCKTGDETEQETCKSEGIKSIRCSMPNPPSEECIQEIEDFLKAASCDEAGGSETTGSGGDDAAIEEEDEDIDDEDIDDEGTTE